MKIKRMLALVLSFSLLCSVPVMAAEGDSAEPVVSTSEAAQYFEDAEFDLADPVQLGNDQINTLLAAGNEIQPLVTTPDKYEPNDTISTASPYNNVDVITTKLTARNQLYTLGMRTANLHSETDEDWYTVSLTAGETYFVDLRNVGLTNIFIELYYIRSDNTGYFYTTDPSRQSVYQNKPEKYFYFEAQDSGTFYIRIANGGGWTADMMNYFFYVGPAIQTFDIVKMPTYGSVQIWGDDYRTYTCNLTGVVPADTAIVSLSMTDSFPQGKECSEMLSYMSAGGRTYYRSSSGDINGIANAPLGQSWTIGGKCSKGSHFTYWSAVLSGKFFCIMAPYPGNELDF